VRATTDAVERGDHARLDVERPQARAEDVGLPARVDHHVALADLVADELGERIVENAQVSDLTLSDDDMAELDALDRTGGTDGARESSWW
jgi:hypothetical protein